MYSTNQRCTKMYTCMYIYEERKTEMGFGEYRRGAVLKGPSFEMPGVKRGCEAICGNWGVAVGQLWNADFTFCS